VAALPWHRKVTKGRPPSVWGFVCVSVCAWVCVCHFTVCNWTRGEKGVGHRLETGPRARVGVRCPHTAITSFQFNPIVQTVLWGSFTFQWAVFVSFCSGGAGFELRASSLLGRGLHLFSLTSWASPLEPHLQLKDCFFIFIIYLLIFVLLEFELRAYTSRHSTNPFLCWDFSR
jgi:hypothetical protein